MNADKKLSAIALVFAAVVFAQPWKNKPMAEWTPAEAAQVLADSPWAKSTVPTLDKSIRPPHTTAGPGGVDVGGVDVGLPIGIGGVRGRGVNGRTQRTPGDQPADSTEMPKLTVRWASALPVTVAELKTREVNAPVVDEDHYAISVYGIPVRYVPGKPDRLAGELKRHAVLKRDGKKEIKASGAEVMMRDDGPVIVFRFPRSSEISRGDSQVEFEAEIDRLKIAQAFVPGEMIYQGKLEM